MKYSHRLANAAGKALLTRLENIDIKFSRGLSISCHRKLVIVLCRCMSWFFSLLLNGDRLTICLLKNDILDICIGCGTPNYTPESAHKKSGLRRRNIP